MPHERILVEMRDSIGNAHLSFRNDGHIKVAPSAGLLTFGCLFAIGAERHSERLNERAAQRSLGPECGGGNLGEGKRRFAEQQFRIRQPPCPERVRQRLSGQSATTRLRYVRFAPS